MSHALPNLTTLPADVQAYIAAQALDLKTQSAEIIELNLKHAATEARLVSEMQTASDARAAYEQDIKHRDMKIADLRLQIAAHKKHRFGSRSESLDQMELVLEEYEIARAADTADEPIFPTPSPRTPRLRKPFPADLTRTSTA